MGRRHVVTPWILSSVAEQPVHGPEAWLQRRLFLSLHVLLPQAQSLGTFRRLSLALGPPYVVLAPHERPTWNPRCLIFPGYFLSLGICGREPAPKPEPSTAALQSAPRGATLQPTPPYYICVTFVPCLCFEFNLVLASDFGNTLRSEPFRHVDSHSWERKPGIRWDRIPPGSDWQSPDPQARMVQARCPSPLGRSSPESQSFLFGFSLTPVPRSMLAPLWVAAKYVLKCKRTV